MLVTVLGIFLGALVGFKLYKLGAEKEVLRFAKNVVASARHGEILCWLRTRDDGKVEMSSYVDSLHPSLMEVLDKGKPPRLN